MVKGTHVGGGADVLALCPSSVSQHLFISLFCEGTYRSVGDRSKVTKMKLHARNFMKKQ